MRIKIKKTSDWDIVYETALITQGKVPKKQFPSEEWKMKTIIAEHSILRELKFIIDIEDVPNFAITHLVRHVHAQPFVRTMREDLTGIPSESVTRNTLNSFRWSLSAQEILNICKVRLCSKASVETRDIIQEIVLEIYKIEPQLAIACVPSCIKNLACPEYKACNRLNNFLKGLELKDVIDYKNRIDIYNKNLIKGE